MENTSFLYWYTFLIYKNFKWMLNWFVHSLLCTTHRVFSIRSIAHYLITISLWHILIFIRLISPHFYFFIIFLEILTCLFFCINIWFNLSTYFKSNLSFYRDQIKLCTKLIITEIFIILIFLTNNTVAFPLLKTVFCASQ